MGEEHTKGICIACKEPILEGASICKHCGVSQSWRKHLHLSSTILALLVALLSVLSTTIPVITGALEPQDAEFNFIFEGRIDNKSEKIDRTMQNFRVGQPLFLLRGFNSGPKAGIFKSIHLEEVNDQNPILSFELYSSILPEPKRHNGIVQANTAVVLYASCNNENINFALMDEFKDRSGIDYQFQLRIAYVDSSLNEREVVVPVRKLDLPAPLFINVKQ